MNMLKKEKFNMSLDVEKHENIICKACSNAGEPITRFETYVDLEADTEYYAIRHWCDIYATPEIRRYMHGSHGGIITELYLTPDNAWDQWKIVNQKHQMLRIMEWFKGFNNGH